MNAPAPPAEARERLALIGELLAQPRVHKSRNVFTSAITTRLDKLRWRALFDCPTPWWPYPGTIRWRGCLGVGRWGTAGCPMALHAAFSDGTIRPATRAEIDWFDKLYGLAAQADAFRRDLGLTVAR